MRPNLRNVTGSGPWLVAVQPTVFPRGRRFPTEAEAITYRDRMKQHDPSAEIVALAPDATEGEPT